MRLGALRPSRAKILLSAALAPLIFLLVLTYLTPVCIDPTAEAWARNPDPEYWGCHTMLHRHIRSVPDFIAVYDLPSASLLALLLSYLAACVFTALAGRFRGREGPGGARRATRA
ncbi:MAG: hypothetical protein LM565_02815 [Thermofilum sp.]|jgi:hypothetical protein|nr:hypothetical protein [Thermofilum sp.]